MYILLGYVLGYMDTLYTCSKCKLQLYCLFVSFACSFFSYLDSIEMAVSNGDCLLLENIEESIDPVLDNLLGRLTIKKGRYIKIGDKEAEYHPK